MKVTLVPLAGSAVGSIPHQYLTSYLINDCVAIDAGALGFYKDPADQAAIQHLFLSHSHIDHLASLPIFLENIAGLSPTPVTVYASEAVQQALRRDLFNDRLWPNFLELKVNDRPFMTLVTIQSGQTVEVHGLRVTAVAVHHVVPTLGFIIEEAASAIVIASDTGPTEALWERANRTPHLKAVFLEATFPDNLTGLADLSMHLTPASFLREMKKLLKPTPFYAVHLKARFRAQVAQELLTHRCADLKVAEFGTTYEF